MLGDERERTLELPRGNINEGRLLDDSGDLLLLLLALSSCRGRDETLSLLQGLLGCEGRLFFQLLECRLGGLLWCSRSRSSGIIGS